MKNTHFIIHLVIALVITIALVCFTKKYLDMNKVIENFIDLQSTMIGVFATVLGFIITAISIILTIKETSFIQLLKQTGHYEGLMKVFFDVCYLSLICMILSIIGKLVIMVDWYYFIEFFIVVFCFIRLVACLYILKSIVCIVSSDTEDD